MATIGTAEAPGRSLRRTRPRAGTYREGRIRRRSTHTRSDRQRGEKRVGEEGECLERAGRTYLAVLVGGADAAGDGAATAGASREAPPQAPDRRVFVDLLDRHPRQVSAADPGAERAIASESAPSSSKKWLSTETSSAPQHLSRGARRRPARSPLAGPAVCGAGGRAARGPRGVHRGLTEVAARMRPPADRASGRPKERRSSSAGRRASTSSARPETSSDARRERAAALQRRGDIAELEPPPRKREPRLEHRSLRRTGSRSSGGLGRRLKPSSRSPLLVPRRPGRAPPAGQRGVRLGVDPDPRRSSSDRATAAAR